MGQWIQLWPRNQNLAPKLDAVAQPAILCSAHICLTRVILELLRGGERRRQNPRSWSADWPRVDSGK